uniref:WAP domain-containing protein n=1 Tax=Romanomermis culicivorax TaxID=13658 RepID=A0A915I3P4_ROMCU
MNIFRCFIITNLHIVLFIFTVLSQKRRCPSDDLSSVFNCGPHFKCPKDYYCYDGSCCPNCVKHNELNPRPQQQRSCDTDGTYSSVQCNNKSNVCWCCTPQGKVVKGTMARMEKFRMRNVTCDDYRLHSDNEFSDDKIFDDDSSSRAFTLSDRDQCPILRNVDSNCTSTCDKDRDCDSRKCCFTGCSYRCLEDNNALKQDAIGTLSSSFSHLSSEQ